MKIELKQIKQNPEILEKLPTENIEIIITKNDKSLYKLTKKRRQHGSAKNLINMSSNFDKHLTEFMEYM